MRMRTILTLALALITGTVRAETWAHTPMSDPLTGRAAGHLFTITSTNTVLFGPPYGGPHHATLAVLFQDTRLSMSVAIPGQILHGEGGRMVLDGGDPRDVSLDEVRDHDPGMAIVKFIDPEFVADAKSIKLEITFFQQGTRILTFESPKPLASSPEWKAYVTDPLDAAAKAVAERMTAEEKRADQVAAATEREADEAEEARMTQLLASACAGSTDLQARAFERVAKLGPERARTIALPYRACLEGSRAKNSAKPLLDLLR